MALVAGSGKSSKTTEVQRQHLVAGAGSGKTRALTYRLAWLVHNGVEPSRIMLVTFTNRAAREMLSRVEVLVKQKTKARGKTAKEEASRTASKPQVSAYLTRARVRAREQDSVKSLMTQARYSLKMPKKGTSFRLLALVCMFYHPKSA